MEGRTLLLVLLCTVISTVRGQFFRTQLFPQQLQQQQLQFQQGALQHQLLALQRQWQNAQGADRRAALQEQQDDLLRRLQNAQDQQQTLQLSLQDALFSTLQQVTGGAFQPPPLQREPVRQFQRRPVQQFQPEPVQQFQPEPVQQFQPEPVQQQFQPEPVQQQFQPEPVQQQFQPEPVQQQFQRESAQQGNQFQQPEPIDQFPDPVEEVQQQVRQVQDLPDFSRVVFQEPDVFVQQVTVAPPCATTAGEAGFCRPLVKCITFYAELPELRRQPCRLQGNEFGVCCPSRKRPSVVQSGNNGVLHAPPPPRVVIPPFTPQQLDQAANVALERIKERLQFIASLFAQNVVVEVGTPAAAHQEFFQTTNATLETGDEAQKNVEASVSLVNQFNLSPDQGTFALPSFSILNTVIADTCPQAGSCRTSKYRTADGSCNNLANPRWGRPTSALQRILPPKYGDGVNSPRSQASNGDDLPSARFISTQFATEADNPDETFTLLLMQWGQFLDHDLTHSPISRGQSGSGLSCCRGGQVIDPAIRHPDCFPIGLPLNDHIFAPFAERCMEFVRSLPAPRPECNFGPREQMNQVTGYMDGSNIYGSSEGTQRELRLGTGGRLKVQNVGGRAMLPANRGECQDATRTMTCFKAGDSRANEQVDLAVMHTVWMREHNRVAGELAAMRPAWSDEEVFQEARRIVVAEMQHVTYNEFLPLVLGRNYMDKFELTPRDNGSTRLYDEELNAGITNVFSSAAFRFGHSLIQSTLKGYSRFGNVREDLVLHQNHFSPFVLYKEGAFDDLIRGLATQTCQRFDRFFSKELTDRLFKGNLDFGLDLVALNIQRGRDHGIPPYNDWRQVCGLPRATSWDTLLEVMDQQSVATLRRLYGSVDEIDLFVAGVAERPIPGALVGPTFVCLIGDQFARLRRGDRFFYEEANQPSSFNQGQLDEIRKVSLARVLCDNSDDIAVMQPLAFFQASFANQRVGCASQSIPRVDLKAWFSEVPRL